MLSQQIADCKSVGLNALSAEEERFHFGMWAINKSPLIIGAAVDPNRLSKTSLEIMSNKEVIAINQDSLAKQAQIARRYTEEQWDIWMGDLSYSRKVVGIANWKNDSQIVTLDLASLGIASAKARDVWAAKDLGVISGVRTLNLTGHQMRLWVLSEVVAATPLSSTSYYHAANASMSGSARPSVCPRGTCLPTGAKAGQIGANASVTFPNVSATSAGKALMGIDFINYDYAFTTAWGLGDNIRNMTIAVNGGRAKRWAFPLSGGNWNESGRLVVEVDRFKNGTSNVVTFGAFGNGTAPDLVGFEILE
jgi:alpha-galactosidase